MEALGTRDPPAARASFKGSCWRETGKSTLGQSNLSAPPKVSEWGAGNNPWQAQSAFACVGQQAGVGCSILVCCNSFGGHQRIIPISLLWSRVTVHTQPKQCEDLEVEVTTALILTSLWVVMWDLYKTLGKRWTQFIFFKMKEYCNNVQENKTYSVQVEEDPL